MALSRILEHVQEGDEWVVVVLADATAPSIMKVLASICPSNVKLSGNTFLCPSGGRMTVTANSNKVRADGYSVVFLGFDKKPTNREELSRHVWYVNAEHVLVFGETDGKLRRAL